MPILLLVARLFPYKGARASLGEVLADLSSCMCKEMYFLGLTLAVTSFFGNIIDSSGLISGKVNGAFLTLKGPRDTPRE